MPRINIRVSPDEDYLISRWFVEITKRHSRQAALYVYTAVRHYILTGTYKNIGTIPKENYHFEKNSYVLTLEKDDLVSAWINQLKPQRIPISSAIRGVLNHSIAVAEKAEDLYIPSVGEIIDIPSVNMAEPLRQMPAPAAGEQSPVTAPEPGEIKKPVSVEKNNLPKKVPPKNLLPTMGGFES